jgi:hypothetical protein
MQRELWVQQWEEARVKPRATTGRQLRQQLLEPCAGVRLLRGELPDDEKLWNKLLYFALARQAAGHVLRTGQILAAPVLSIRDREDRKDCRLEQSRLAEWQIWVQKRAGGFLHWCDRSGIDTKKGFRLPDNPPASAWEAVQYDLQDGLDDADKWPFTEADAAKLFGVSVADLPAALHDYIRGRFGSFLDLMPAEE